MTVTPILQRRLILVMGKGGVGRSTVAASIAAATARSGRKTLLFQANAKDRFGSLFAQPAVGPQIRELRENLFSLNTSATHALEEYGLMILRFKRIYSLVFENRISEAFLKAIPGIEEYSILGKAWYHTQEKQRNSPRWDTVVFDMAASGHSLSMLRIPWAITDAVPDGPLTRDAKKIRTLLGDKNQTAAIMVTLAEEMPCNEAIELSEKLKKHIDLDVDALVVNQVYKEIFPAGSPQAMILDTLREKSSRPSENQNIKTLLKTGLQSLSRCALNQEHLRNVQEKFALPLAVLPRLFVPALKPEDIEFFSETIASSFLTP